MLLSMMTTMMTHIQLLSAELMLLNDDVDGYIRVTEIKHAKNNIEHPIGTRHADPNLDSMMYIDLMADGHEKELQHKP